MAFFITDLATDPDARTWVRLIGGRVVRSGRWRSLVWVSDGVAAGLVPCRRSSLYVLHRPDDVFAYEFRLLPVADKARADGVCVALGCEDL